MVPPAAWPAAGRNRTRPDDDDDRARSEARTIRLNLEPLFGAVDALDCALLRGLFRNRVLDFQGTDPRRSMAEVADYAGVSRNAVTNRLKSWRESGFLAGSSVFPNPDQFGRAFSGRFFRTQGAQELADTEAKLRGSGVVLVYEAGSVAFGDALVGGIWALPHGRTGKGPGPGKILQGTTSVSEPFPVLFPRSTEVLSPIDWRIARSYRAYPSASGPEVAKRVGTSPRQVRRRLSHLLDHDSLFFLPQLDFTRARGTVLLLTAVTPKGPVTEEVRRAIAERYPDRLPVAPVAMSEHLFPRAAGAPEIATSEFLLPVRSAQLGWSVAKGVRELDGVMDLIVTFPIRNYEEPRTYDALLGVISGSTEPSAAAPSSGAMGVGADEDP